MVEGCPANGPAVAADGSKVAVAWFSSIAETPRVKIAFSQDVDIYSRLELVDKDELLRPADRSLVGIVQHNPSYRIGAYTFGGVRDLLANEKGRSELAVL